MAADTLIATAQPLVCADLELSAPELPGRSPADGLALLVRLHGEPMGDFEVDASAADNGLDAVIAIAQSLFADQIAAHLEADGLAPGSQPPIGEPVVGCRRRAVPARSLRTTVIICTLGKHALLPRAIQSILDQDYQGDLQLLVVDNAPATGLARAVLAGFDDARIAHAEQPIPGLSNARNAGLAEATGEVLLFTDDDVIADPGWVRSIVAAFAASDDVDAVTGLVVPGSLATGAEQVFEAACGFNKGYQGFVWSTKPTGAPIYSLAPKGSGGPLFPFAAGRFGSGNNMAWRASSIRRLDGFDPAMWCSEDIDSFFRLIFAGGVLVYEPRAVVRHFHRDTYDALVKQMRNYGVGFTSFMTKQCIHTKGAALALIKATAKVGAAVVSGRKSTADGGDAISGRSVPVGYPKELLRIELTGMATGPWIYLRDRHRIKASQRRKP